MKNFLQGIIFISLLLPMIEGILSLFNQIIKHICTFIAVKTYGLEQSINKEEEETHNPIGFQPPPIETIENYEEYEGDE